MVLRFECCWLVVVLFLFLEGFVVGAVCFVYVVLLVFDSFFFMDVVIL